jgi:hypothetical protein
MQQRQRLSPTRDNCGDMVQGISHRSTPPALKFALRRSKTSALRSPLRAHHDAACCGTIGLYPASSFTSDSWLPSKGIAGRQPCGRPTSRAPRADRARRGKTLEASRAGTSKPVAMISPSAVSETLRRAYAGASSSGRAWPVQSWTTNRWLAGRLTKVFSEATAASNG